MDDINHDLETQIKQLEKREKDKTNIIWGMIVLYPLTLYFLNGLIKNIIHNGFKLSDFFNHPILGIIFILLWGLLFYGNIKLFFALKASKKDIDNLSTPEIVSARERKIKEALKKSDKEEKNYIKQEENKEKKDLAKTYTRNSGKMHANFHDKTIDFSGSFLEAALKVNFQDIVSYKPVINGHNVKKHHGITRSLVGATIAGGAGAIVGAVTGGKQFDVISEIYILIFFKDGSSKKITYLNHDLKRNSTTAKTYLEDCNRGIAIIEAVLAANNDEKATISKKNAQQTNTENSLRNSSDADELMKFKEMLDEGIISQEEFNIKKHKIINK